MEPPYRDARDAVIEKLRGELALEREITTQLQDERHTALRAKLSQSRVRWSRWLAIAGATVGSLLVVPATVAVVGGIACGFHWALMWVGMDAAGAWITGIMCGVTTPFVAVPVFAWILSAMEKSR